MNDAVRNDRRPLEQEAAFKLSQWARREFGLTPSEADADLRGDRLTVRLRQALTPMGRAIARSGGEQAVQRVYALLHEVHHPQMERMIARIAGVPVRGSQVGVDVSTEDVLFSFCLDLTDAARAGRRR